MHTKQTITVEQQEQLFHLLIALTPTAKILTTMQISKKLYNRIAKALCKRYGADGLLELGMDYGAGYIKPLAPVTTKVMMDTSKLTDLLPE